MAICSTSSKRKKVLFACGFLVYNYFSSYQCCYLGPQLEPESIDSDAEGKTTVGFNSVKEADLSVLDEILSVKSGGTTSILDDGGGQQQKEVIS